MRIVVAAIFTLGLLVGCVPPNDPPPLPPYATTCGACDGDSHIR